MTTPEGGAADLADLAAETARETEAAIPPPHGAPAAPTSQPSPAASTTGPTDRWGRAFDPNIHLTNKVGEPAVNRKTGRLLCLPGQGLGRAVAPKPAAPGVGASSLGDMSGELEPGPAAGGDAAEEVMGGPEPVMFDPAGAELDSRVVRRALRWLGRWMGGPEEGDFKTAPDDEGGDIQQAYKDWAIDNQIRLPVGAGFMLFLSVGSYLNRVWNTPRHQQRMEDLMDRINGRPVRVRDEGKRQDEGGQPGQTKEAPRQAARVIESGPVAIDGDLNM